MNVIPFAKPPERCPQMIVCGTPAVVELFARDLFPGWSVKLGEFHYTDNNPQYGRLTHPNGESVPVYWSMTFNVAKEVEGKVVCVYPATLTDAWAYTPKMIITVTLPRNRHPQFPTLQNLTELGVKPIGYILRKSVDGEDLTSIIPYRPGGGDSAA